MNGIDIARTFTFTEKGVGETPDSIVYHYEYSMLSQTATIAWFDTVYQLPVAIAVKRSDMAYKVKEGKIHFIRYTDLDWT